MISGEHFEFRSLSLWTVWVFLIPQQFQLKTTKEEEDEGCENRGEQGTFELDSFFALI